MTQTTVEYVCRCCGGYGAHETAFDCQDGTDDCFCISLTGPTTEARRYVLAKLRREVEKLLNSELRVDFGLAVLALIDDADAQP